MVMNKKNVALTEIIKYRNRQVVLNYYDNDEFLFKREGFFFDSIEIKENHLNFSQKDTYIFSLSLIDFPASRIMSDFANHYAIYNNYNVIYIYFPH